MTTKRRFLAGLLTGTVKHVLRALLYGLVGAVVLLVIVFVIILERRPDLEVWHTVHLDEEFTTKSRVTSFDQYLALEGRLFEQLEREVYSKSAVGSMSLNRYQRGSRADPGRWSSDWNRTFVLAAPEPRVGVLLLHGLSDSPYSMRSLGERLHAAGASVVALRVPGHGTAPSGLVYAEWQDWAAAVELAMRHLREVMGERPLYLVGYSNGGALAVHYTLTSLADPSLPAVAGVALMSPEIAITDLAALAAWQERLGRLLGLRKLSWNSISVEYNPFKYQSFALNAARQAHDFTGEIQRLITALTESGEIARFPPVLAFQSVVDATVKAPALVKGFFARLPAGQRELVLFDLNRVVGPAMEPLFRSDPRAGVDALFAQSSRTFAISLVTNESEGSDNVVARRAGAGETTTVDAALGLAWPHQVYSLSHVALPFPPDDPLYGGPEAQKGPGIQLGNLVLRGERDVLTISASEILRLQWNPFYPYLEQRVLAFMDLSSPPGRTE